MLNRSRFHFFLSFFIAQLVYTIKCIHIAHRAHRRRAKNIFMEKNTKNNRRNCLDYRKPIFFFFRSSSLLCISVISFVPLRLLAHSLNVLKFVLEYDSSRLLLILAYLWIKMHFQNDVYADAACRLCCTQVHQLKDPFFYLFLFYGRAWHHTFTRFRCVCAELCPYV